ncbi:MAG: DUF2997 domain-containing protein [Pirellulales bacterium]
MIVLLITTEGQACVEAHGFSGADCRQATEFIRRALGATLSEQLTPEFYTQPQSQPAQTEQHP